MAKPLQRIRWTIERAAPEFGLDPKTLSSRLKRGGIVAGADGKYSTVQVMEAVVGSLESERIRKTSAEADQIEMQNSEAEKRLIDVDEFTAIFAPILIEMKRLVLSFPNISDGLRDELLGELAKLQVANEPIHAHRP